MAGAISVLGLVRWAFHYWRDQSAEFPTWFFIVAAVFAVLGLVLPRVLQPVFVVWMRFALLVNWVMTHLLLTIAFVFMIAPMGLVKRVVGEPPLNSDLQPDAESYWEEPDAQPTDLDAYKNQF